MTPSPDGQWSDERLDAELARLPRVEVDRASWDGMVERAVGRARARREGRTVWRLALATAVACGLAWLTGTWSVQSQSRLVGPVPAGPGQPIMTAREAPGWQEEGFIVLYEEPWMEEEPDDRSSSAPEVRQGRLKHV